MSTRIAYADPEVVERAQEALDCSQHSGYSPACDTVYLAAFVDGWGGLSRAMDAQQLRLTKLDAAYSDAYDAGLAERLEYDESRRDMLLNRIPDAAGPSCAACGSLIRADGKCDFCGEPQS